MADTLSEASESKNGMTHNCSSCISTKQCDHIKSFEQFLHGFSKDCGNNQSEGEGLNVSCNGCSGSVVLRPLILTRSNSESYPVTKDEVDAEIIMCIWHWLYQKQCPEHFQVGILLSAEEEIKNELKIKKIQEDLKITKHPEETSDVIIDVLKLQKFIQDWLEKFLLHLSDNSNAENLKNFAECSKGNFFNYTVPTSNNCKKYVEAHIKNKPRKMEDRHICLPQFSQIYQVEKPLSFYGVFDGHSGSMSATYATNQIPYRVAQQLKTLHDSSSGSDIYRDALETSFLQVDYNFGQKQLSSGTTAVCALLIQEVGNSFKHLYVAWVGDSKCLLVSPSVHLQLVKPHKPDSVEEKKRIESAETGGSVIFVQGQCRVNGIINVSRSIGDYAVKAVIAEPDIVDVPIQPSHDFLVLGTDGLWDHVSEREIIDCIYKSIVDDEQSLDDIPKHLIQLAKEGDSQDNITVVLVFLKQRHHIKEFFLKSITKSS